MIKSGKIRLLKLPTSQEIKTEKPYKNKVNKAKDERKRIKNKASMSKTRKKRQIMQKMQTESSVRRRKKIKKRENDDEN